MDLMEFVKNQPKYKRLATYNQIRFAKKIAETLNIDLPDFSDFNVTNEFISDNVGEYNETFNY